MHHRPVNPTLHGCEPEDGAGSSLVPLVGTDAKPPLRA